MTQALTRAVLIEKFNYFDVRIVDNINNSLGMWYAGSCGNVFNVRNCTTDDSLLHYGLAIITHSDYYMVTSGYFEYCIINKEHCKKIKNEIISKNR